MKSIHFGLVIPVELHPPASTDSYLVDVRRMLDRAAGHFRSAWTVDHLQFGDVGVLEGFTTLSYLAAIYPDLHFGHGVVSQSFRNPALLAKMGATLQLLTGGRYIMGLGAGWNEEEYRAYGYDFPSNKIRVDQLAETLEIIRRMWTRESASFEGVYHKVDNARCEPRPDPPPKIMLGAWGPRMLQLAAKHADLWNVSSTEIGEFQQLSTALDDYCEAIGRDPTTLRRTWMGGCALAETAEKASALAGARYDPGDFVGTPAQVVEQILQFVEVGADMFVLDPAGFPDSGGLDLLIEEVLPAVRANVPAGPR